MAVAHPDEATFGSTVVDSASDKARRFLDAMRLTRPQQRTAGNQTAQDGKFRSGLEGSKILLISPPASPSIVDEPTGFRHHGPLADPAIPNRQIQRDIIAASRPPAVFLGPLPSDLTRVELVSLLAPYDVVDWSEVGQTDEQGHRTEMMVLQVQMKEDEGKEAVEFDAKKGMLRCRGKVVKVLDVEKRKKELAMAEEVGKDAGAASTGHFGELREVLWRCSHRARHTLIRFLNRDLAQTFPPALSPSGFAAAVSPRTSLQRRRTRRASLRRAK